MGSHKTSEIRRCSRFRELQPSPFAVFFTAVQPWTTQRIFFRRGFGLFQALSPDSRLGAPCAGGARPPLSGVVVPLPPRTLSHRALVRGPPPLVHSPLSNS